MSLSISGVKGALVVFESRRIAGSRAVCSLPAYLNNLRAPSLREIPAILRGESITDAVLRIESMRSAVALYPVYRKAGLNDRDAAQSALASSGMSAYLESDIAELLALIAPTMTQADIEAYERMAATFRITLRMSRVAHQSRGMAECAHNAAFVAWALRR